MGRRVLRRVLRRGSKKGLSRSHLEGRNTPFQEYNPLGVRHALFHGKDHSSNSAGPAGTRIVVAQLSLLLATGSWNVQQLHAVKTGACCPSGQGLQSIPLRSKTRRSAFAMLNTLRTGGGGWQESCHAYKLYLQCSYR